MYQKYGKRILDCLMSIFTMMILAPVYLLLAIFIKIKLGSPILFKQKRPGKDNRIFTLYKFRTMTDERDENGELLSDELRLTKLGRFLRSTSLDELPELWNVLKGDMSLVGPRPQLVKDLVFMTEEQKKRHSVKQGLTGLAQINGRNAISWEEKLGYDLAYIENITFLNDMKILGLTITKVLAQKDISAINLATAEDLGDYLLRTKQITQKEYEVKQKEAIALLKAEEK